MPMDSTNPFYHRQPIGDPRYFYGRQREVRQLFDLVRQGQSVSLTGPRRIGKTSLLLHLSDVQTSHGLSPDEYVFVYLAGEGLEGSEQVEVYRMWLEDLSDHLDAPGLGSEVKTYRHFERAIRRVTGQGYKLIFLLDEFEGLSHNPCLGLDFFSGLRALTSRHPVVYVVASVRSLLELTYADESALTSPFFNIFLPLNLGLWSLDEARFMVSDMATRAGMSLPPDILEQILTLAGGHPFFLQMAAYHAFAALQGEDNVESWPERFKAEAEPHLTYYWRNLSDEARYALATLSIASQPQTVLEELGRACLIMSSGVSGSQHAFSALADFVRRQEAPHLLQVAPYTIDYRRHVVLFQGQPLKLTRLQLRLFAYLMERADQVIGYEELERAVWEEEYVEDPERLKATIKNLRQALGPATDCIVNVRGVGYTFQV
jgi:hypothetical protein